MPQVERKQCNCYLLLKEVFEHVPRLVELQGRASMTMGNVAVFDYDGIPHVAVVTGQGFGYFTIREWNYDDCEETVRDVSFLDPSLLGFVQL